METHLLKTTVTAVRSIAPVSPPPDGDTALAASGLHARIRHRTVTTTDPLARAPPSFRAALAAYRREAYNYAYRHARHQATLHNLPYAQVHAFAHKEAESFAERHAAAFRTVHGPKMRDQQQQQQQQRQQRPRAARHPVDLNRPLLRRLLRGTRRLLRRKA